SSVSKPLPMAIKKYSEVNDLELDSYPSLEAQIASISDDVAYNSHDFDDGLHAWLFDIKDIMEVPLVGDMVSEVNSLYPNLERSRLIHEIIRRLIAVMIDDVVDETRLRLNNEKPSSVEDVRKCKKPLVGFSDEMSKNDKAFKNFLFPNMYRHYKVNRMTSKAERILKDLFELLVSDIKLLPDDWRQRAGNEPNTQKSARVVCDYIAGMTDKFALDEHARLFDPRVKI
ncbi:MAG: deoxyguanosinetriphosphate triphosphohydrolase, partial [Alphaproteobacteria bacterium]|nr:deoxyguanosinetriphosphate triphosphohydrolase [Alphaproteobacteria bacterium]